MLMLLFHAVYIHMSAIARITVSAEFNISLPVAGNLLVVLTYRCLHSTALLYLADELYRVPNTDSRRRLRSALTSHTSYRQCATPPLAIANFRSQLHAYGTVWCLASPLPRSPTTFRQHLKSELFFQCFGPNCIWRFCSTFLFSASCSTPNVSFFIVNRYCSPRILSLFNHINS